MSWDGEIPPVEPATKAKWQAIREAMDPETLAQLERLEKAAREMAGAGGPCRACPRISEQLDVSCINDLGQFPALLVMQRLLQPGIQSILLG